MIKKLITALIVVLMASVVYAIVSYQKTDRQAYTIDTPPGYRLIIVSSKATVSITAKYKLEKDFFDSKLVTDFPKNGVSGQLVGK